MLLLANKQDQEDALDEIDLIEQLDIENLVNKNQCPTLVKTCAASEHKTTQLDNGIRKGYEWLMEFIIRNYDSLNNRVRTDAKEQEHINKEIINEKRERLRRLKEEEQKNQHDIDAIESYSDYARKLNGDILNANHLDGDDDVLSTNSLPAIHARPKSAVQIVSQQLQMNKIKQKIFKMPSRKNKTAPISLYDNRPQSATSNQQRNSKIINRRAKSANNSRKICNSVPRNSAEVFTLNNFEKPLKNGWTHN